MSGPTRIVTLAMLGFAIASCDANPPGSPASPEQAAGAAVGWPMYGGDARQDHYSSLTQINRTNVGRLKQVWRFDANELGDSETNPLIIGRTLFAYTPEFKVISLDGATGTLRWKFDSGIRGSGPQRGLTFWTDGTEQRLFASVMNRLYALDPASGKPIASFGDHGFIDLRKDLRGDHTQHYVSLTSPGIIYKDLLIVGFRTVESKPAPPGDIRAFDVHTGQLRWTFHTIPHPGEFAYEEWPKDAWQYSGSANNWAGFALDQERGIVYVPTGSAVSDFYGADRSGSNLFADCLLALDAATGKRLWHFQTTHHDVWDRDLPSAPVLLTVQHGGKRVAAVAQTSKQGYVYVFDRVTGVPLFPVEERPVPASTVPGEVTAPTQPVPLLPEPFARQRLTEDMLTTRTPEAHAWALQQFRSFRSDGQFVPLGVDRPTVVFPGFDGGAEWGGAALDPHTGVIYVNANGVAWTGMLAEVTSSSGIGASHYQVQCSVCHGLDRKGSPPGFPSLIDIGKRLSSEQVAAVIRIGRGRMPPFKALSDESLDALVQFIRTGRDPTAGKASVTAAGSGASGAGAKQEMQPLDRDMSLDKYQFTGYNKFLDPDGYPAVAPPWGTLNAIDLNTGKYLWKIPLGEYPDLAAHGMKNTGSENYGGPILTASGLLFIGATIYDRKLRAFDSASGELLWETELPFSGTATPATYMIDGKQFVVICTSSARDRNAPQGSAYVAFALQ
ncbi:MAG TPA: PQQ-binding-like beta-propeller repeat protein [Steroidobacteraceae bacterium]|jgi:quinoprotein glucose dehydrogenase|nr:PQQ-binding-like beta-propeller repeat protein [Steroidobacteraceae bacterium]